jgi:hypothetical protein
VTRRTLLRELDKTTENARRSLGGAKPREGATVTLWQLPGRWGVWSKGPTSTSWWLRPSDDLARSIVAQLAADPSLGDPVVQRVAQGCIAVRTRDIR